MQANQQRINNLIEYVQGMMNQEDGKQLYARNQGDIEQVTPQEVFEIFYAMLLKNVQPSEILVFLDKIINVFYKSLVAYPWERPEENSFLGYLIKENRALASKLDGIKEILKETNLTLKKKQLIPKVEELMQFRNHYLKKENILFPFMEKKMEKFNGLAIMWALHDETRALLKRVIECLESAASTEQDLNAVIGKLFFAMLGLVKKEDLILFPAASEIFDEDEWVEMQRQSMEYEFPFIEKPTAETNISVEKPGEGYQFKTETGALSFEQILMMFNTMPVDMTFVDENNKVRYFTRPKDRLFPRSPAVIGRDVANCHPPESVHMVHEIIDAFKEGRQDQATFWINIKGKKILIQYFALRDETGNYKGIVEVGQDITEIQKLEGERRLLQWDENNV